VPEPTSRQGGRPDNYLTNVALRYGIAMGNVYIADKVFPVAPVNQSAAKYKVFPRSYFMRDEVAVRPLGGTPRVVGYRLSEESYFAEEEALRAKIDVRERVDAGGTPGHDIERAKTELLMSQHLIHRDRRWASEFFKTGVWGTDLTGVASGTPTSSQFLRWDNDNSNPIKEISTRAFGVGQKVGGAYRPRTLVLGVDVFIALQSHPLILDRMADSEARVIDNQVLANFFGVDRVLVPQGVVNTGPEKESVAATEAAAVYQYIVDTKDALLVYSAPRPSTEMPSGGYVFAWTGLLGTMAFDPTAAVTRGRDDSYSDWIDVRVAYDMKVTAPELGVFFDNAVT